MDRERRLAHAQGLINGRAARGEALDFALIKVRRMDQAPARIDRLLIGARAEDVMELTEFDEGPLPADWIGELNKRGIEVVRDLRRDDARAVLRRYGESGGDRY